ncbi:NADP-dependent oxidoreductase [Lysobacter sp. Root983]|uniref:NADP-dependent oxidoreductase n=1 Tax=Lysobacter sp. Root983 TaxID=1736613 RepID=UPI000A831791|nr:NADP-dependent oxidoreductase [Lysobacter sp. Root983]
MDNRNAREDDLDRSGAHLDRDADLALDDGDDGLMQAVHFDRYGSPDVLYPTALAMPNAARGELRVRVRAAGVQPADIARRNGEFARRGIDADAAFPQRLGYEFAGVVDQIGDGVRGYYHGQEVLGWCDGGAYAEVLAVPAAQVVAKPPMMSWAVAGALSASGQTAQVALRALNVGRGDTLLVHGAAGGVGSIAVQLARLAGARVIGSASRENHAYLRTLGVEPVLYGEGLVARVRELAPQGVSAALDAAGRGAIAASLALGAARERIGTLVDADGAREHGVLRLRGECDRDRLRQLVELYEHGRLHVHVREIYPLAHAAVAHRDVETGHGRGKVVLMVYQTGDSGFGP